MILLIIDIIIYLLMLTAGIIVAATVAENWYYKYASNANTFEITALVISIITVGVTTTGIILKVIKLISLL